MTFARQRRLSRAHVATRIIKGEGVNRAMCDIASLPSGMVE
ncbi:hypothetical protein V1282_000295 [Nitrobacteraceae bacterium AZCC 2146]